VPKRWLSTGPGRALAAMLCLILLAPLLGGCWGKREIEELGFTLAVGLDKGERPGTYAITYQMAVPKKGTEGGAEIQNRTVTVQASSMVEASQELFRVVERQDFPGSTKIIILGRDLAESGINAALDFYQRLYLVRRTSYLLLAEDKAKDILETKLNSQQLPALSILALIDATTEWSVVPKVRLGHYLTVLGRGSEAPVIPVVKAVSSGTDGISYPDGQKAEAGELMLEGAGVFKQDKLIGRLSDAETKGYLWLQNEVKARLLDTRDQPGPDYGARVLKTSTKANLATVEGVRSVVFDIRAEVSLEEVRAGNVEGAQGAQELAQDAEAQLEAAIKSEADKAVAKSRQLGADFLGVGRIIEMKDPRYWRQIKDRWPEFLAEVPINVQVRVKVVSTGSSFGSPSKLVEEGQE